MYTKPITRGRYRVRAFSLFRPKKARRHSWLYWYLRFTLKHMTRSGQEPDDYRALLYARQSVINTLFVDDKAINACQRWLQFGQNDVIVKEKGEKIGYGHLQTCKKRWLCPVCADRMARQTRARLARAIQSEAACGYRPLFITYTAHHVDGEPLAESARRIGGAHRILHSGKRFSRSAESVHYDGSFRALEITIGNAGWHFHIHELAFIGRDQAAGAFTDVCISGWRAAVAKMGGYASQEHGLDISEADVLVKNYITKFGLAAELTQGQQKTKAAGGLLPFQLADLALQNPSRRAWAADCFAEYAAATKGLKQTDTGGALRPLFKHIKDNPDVPNYETNILASLTVDQWRRVLRAGKRAALLKCVKDRDRATFDQLVGRA